MKFFQKLVIENFQSHQHTEIHFSKGLNVFVGPSDSGKSSILRALRWVLFNYPRGNDFIRVGTKECWVTLLFTDGTKITRIRGTSVNRYLLHTPDGKEQVFEGFGNTVPREISTISHVQAIKLDQKEIIPYFGTQLESPFLLFESDRTKSQIIGRISGAQWIDQALKKAHSERQFTQSEIKQLEQRVTHIQEKIKEYEDLPFLEERLIQAEKAYEKAAKRKREIEILSRCYRQFQSMTSEKELILKEMRKWDHLSQAEILFRELEKKKNRYQQVKVRYEKWFKLKEEKIKWQCVMDQSISLPRVAESATLAEIHIWRFYQIRQLHMRWKQYQQQKGELRDCIHQRVHVPRLIQKVQHIEEKMNRVKILQSVAKIWLDVKSRISMGRKFCQEKEKEIAYLTGEWARLLQKLEKCPTCGSYMSGSAIERIMEEYRGGNIHAITRRGD